MSEQLRLHEVRGDVRAVYGNEFFAGKDTLVVYGSGNDLFTRSALVADQQSRPGAGDAVDDLKDPIHRLTLTYDPLQPDDRRHLYARIFIDATASFSSLSTRRCHSQGL